MIEPKLLALLLCDSVERNPLGRKSLYGLLERIECRTFPARISEASIFGRFGFGEGEFDIRYVVKGPGDSIVFAPAGTCRIVLPDTVETRDVVLTLNGVELQEPGIYWVEAWCNDRRLKPELAISVVEQGSLSQGPSSP